MSETKTVMSADYQQIRARLLARDEIAFLDVREEAPHATGHPLFAANMALSRLELVAYAMLPRMDVPVVTIDGGEGLAETAAERLNSLGYVDVRVFQGGVEAWSAAGGELFIDVNVPSKAFGELMEAVAHTPSMPAGDVMALIASEADHVILDVAPSPNTTRCPYPGGVNVPGADLVLRIGDLVPSPDTTIIINCAGRTRGLLGTQSLINAGLPNPVLALRNGTIGWLLAHQTLDVGQTRVHPSGSRATRDVASRRARRVADRCGVGRVGLRELSAWSKQDGRTTYFFDVRSEAEYAKGHFPGFASVPGGQLLQETEMRAPVRGARIVLVDDDGVRANMTASWLAQMAWEVFVVEGAEETDFAASGPAILRLPQIPEVRTVDADTLSRWLKTPDAIVVVDFSTSRAFCKAHIPGAWFIIRSELVGSVPRLPKAARYVLTGHDATIPSFAASAFETLSKGEVFVLDGGNAAWFAAGKPSEAGDACLASEPIDEYRRPYVGTDVSDEAMQAYLDWEFGLVAQLERDSTHQFKPLEPHLLYGRDAE